MTEKSIIKGKREEIILSDHKITIIAPYRLIDYEKGRKKLRKLLKDNA